MVTSHRGGDTIHAVQCQQSWNSAAQHAAVDAGDVKLSDYPVNMDHQQDLEHTAILNSRRFAPIPRRSRAVDRKADVDGSSVPAMDGSSPTLKTMAAQTYASANELAKAAEELLEHFDQATLKGDKAVDQGRVLAQGSDKANRRIVLDRGLHEDGSDSSAGGEVEIKISGLMTPEESSSSKNGLSEDGNMAVIADAYNTPRDWSTGRTPASSESASSTRREHDCEHDGCYGLTARFIDDDRLSDDYAARGGGKKRKVPASAQQGPTQSGERDETSCVHSCGHICNEATTSTILDTMNRRTHPDETSSVDGSDSLHDQQSCPHVRCCDRHSSIRIVPDPIIRVPKRRMTAARTAIEFEKRLFHARKAQVLGLHADAVTCLGQSKQKNAPVVPSKDELEELVKALEYTGVTGWEGDRVGSGAGLWEGHVLRGRIKNGTLTGTAPTTTSGSEPNQTEQASIPQSPGKLKWRKQGRIAERQIWRSRKPVKRGGWIPEGTFEFEMPSTVASTVQKSTHNLNALRAKVTQLLTLTLSSPSMTSFLNGKPISAPALTKGESQKTTENTVAPSAPGKRDRPSAEPDTWSSPVHTLPTSSPPAADAKQDDQTEQKPRTNKVHHNAHNVTVEPSADDPDYVPPPFSNAAGAKKGKKKKKKSALANAANPHHVKNYVPSRRPVNAPQADMPNLVDFLSMLFFPPPTRFLNAKPGRNDNQEEASGLKSANTRRRETQTRPSADPTDEEYVCCFCEYDLFFGSEQAMDKAVRRRKKVLDRRQKAQEKAKGVMAGKGLRSKPARAGDNGESEDEERCAGGEQCRCAEIRAQEDRNQSRDADSRGIEDTQSTDGTESEPLNDEDELGRTADPSLPQSRDRPALPDEPEGDAAATSNLAESGDGACKAILPEVETFDLGEVTVS